LFKEKFMTIVNYDPKQAITLTESARKHIRQELSKQPDKKGFKFFLEKSGCSGFMYETELSEAPANDDNVFDFDDTVHVFVPNKDMHLLFGTEIDFVKVGLNSMFQFKNPNVKGECGCGESFTVTEE
jgi:iron-sulfur cluster assembly accessory protein